MAAATDVAPGRSECKAKPLAEERSSHRRPDDLRTFETPSSLKVGEQPFEAAGVGDCGVQGGDDVGGLEHRPGGAGDQEAGVVVDDVEDLDFRGRWPTASG